MMRAIAVLLVAFIAAGCNSRVQPPVEPAAGQVHDHGHQQSHDHETHAGHDHGESEHHAHAATRTTLDVRPVGEIKAGEPSAIQMSIAGQDGQPVKDFELSHEAKVHLIIVRDGLDQFVHLHPEVNDETGELTIRHTFPVGGTYHLFADYHTQDSAGLAIGDVAVAGESPTAPALTPDVPGTVAGDGLTANVSIEGGNAGGETTIEFLLTTPEGKPVKDLESYMGAMGHLNAVSADATQFVHLHPVEGGRVAHRVTFTGRFPAAALYKGWGQFKRNGEVQVVPFVLKVE